MRYLLLLSTILIMGISVSAQETVTKKGRMSDEVSERYTVLKSDQTTKEGLYLAFISGTTNALARGYYKNNIKSGKWDFFDTQNQLIQRYDYTEHKLVYEAPEDSTSNCRYVVDDSLTSNTISTKPVRIGDRYYGYVNYLKAFQLPPDLRGVDPNVMDVLLELLVSPYGRLADYKVHLSSVKYHRTLTFNLDLLSEEDKTFLPATVAGKPTSCRIFVQCALTRNGQIVFD